MNGNTQVSSADRLRRVRGHSKHPGPSNTADDENDLDLDDAIILGDILALKILLEKIFAVGLRENNVYET